MSTTLKPAEADVIDLSAKIVSETFPELEKAGVTFCHLMASNPEGPALKLHGHPCAAIVRPISYKDRVKGMADVEIQICFEEWENLTPEERAGLLDHELEHVQVVYKDGELQTDKLGRPKITMKPHDFECGWFKGTAERRGAAAPEVMQAKRLLERFGGVFFPGMRQELELKP